ncbi:hypothetical protein [Pedobacter sp.]|uniref:hypothetical protein n=1 Tax=Pedobacter sp. TaxID=1411316 RepID=UPI003C68F0B6
MKKLILTAALAFIVMVGCKKENVETVKKCTTVTSVTRIDKPSSTDFDYYSVALADGTVIKQYNIGTRAAVGLKYCYN